MALELRAVQLYISACSALKNIHIQMNALRAEDAIHHRLCTQILYEIGDDITKKCRRKQERYLNKCHGRIELQFRYVEFSNRDIKSE